MHCANSGRGHVTWADQTILVDTCVKHGDEEKMLTIHAEHLAQRVTQRTTLGDSEFKPDKLHEQEIGVETVVIADGHDLREGDGYYPFALIRRAHSVSVTVVEVDRYVSPCVLS